MQVRSLDQEDPLEEEMATCSSILAWKIPWTEETGGYSPWGHKQSDMTELLSISCNAGHLRDEGLTPGSGRSPGGKYGKPLQYSCLENPMDRGDWRATVHGVTKS